MTGQRQYRDDRFVDVSRAIRLRNAATKGVAVLLGALVIVPLSDRSCDAAESPAFVAGGEYVRRVTIILNKSRTFPLPQFSKVNVGSPDIVDAMPISDRVLYVQGKRIGTTNIAVFDANARLISVFDVEVTPDIVDLREKIRASIGADGIRVSSSGDQIVLTGVAPDAVAAERALEVAKASSSKGVINAMQVAPTQQVLLHVRMLEVDRTAGRELGVNLFAAGASGTRGINTGLPGGSQNPVFNSPPSSNNAQLPIIQGAGTLLGTTNPFVTVLGRVLSSNGTTIDALVTALEQKGLVRALAEPDLIALSGDTAHFHVGGQIPVPVPTQTGIGVPTIAIQWKDFGVELNFTPTVLAKGIIDLRLVPSVSELDFTNAVQISGTTVPALTVRSAATRVELRDGQSFAIAGLLQTEGRRNLSQVPWIGSVPVLGTLFRSSQFQQNETDLVILVTPHLVSPAVPGQRLASPLESRLPSNDVDFFLNGQPEVKKQYGDFVAAGGGLTGPYGHIMRPDIGIDHAVKVPGPPDPKLAQ
jgi:pilus assembly protein CpaC